MDGSNYLPNRRKVLKSIGTGTAAIGMVSPTMARQNGSKFEGFAYDPVTHEVVGEVSGQFNDQHQQLRGNLRMDVPDTLASNLGLKNGRVNVNKLRKRTETSVSQLPKTQYGFDESEGEIPGVKSVRLSTVGDSVVGYLQRGGTQVAYSMVPKRRGTASLEQLIRRTGFQGATGRTATEVE